MTSINYDYLYQLAKTSIDHGMLHGAPLFLNPRFLDPVYTEKGCTFVSLKIDGRYAGCIGNLVPEMLYNSVLSNAFKSAFKDERYPPLNKNIMQKTTMQVLHLLNNFRIVKVNNIDELTAQITKDDTLQVSLNGKSSIMLSFVQRDYKTIQDFILATMNKGNIPTNGNWNEIEFKLFPTIESPQKRLIEIEPCQNYI